MMKINDLLENFESVPDAISKIQDSDDEELEDLKLKSFEAGYSAGWEDAINAQRESGKFVSEALKQSLLDLQFTREEALQSFLTSSQNLFEQVFKMVLSRRISAALPQHVYDILEDAILKTVEGELQIRTSEADNPNVQNMLKEHKVENCTTVIDPELTDGQATVAIGSTEQQIDLMKVTDEIENEFRSFLHLELKG